MKYIVLGAGPSGLAFLKELREAGLDAVCFEADRTIGGVFARPYDGARLTSSNLTTTFSDLPPLDLEPRIWTFAEYMAYLHRYVEHFDLGPHIHLSSPVASVSDDGERFTVSFAEGVGRAPVIGDRLAVCTGTHQVPVMPTLPGAEVFAGQIMHSSEFERADALASRRVLVVGGGESASDISLEVARVARESAVSVRDHFGHIVPRNASEVSAGAPDVGASDVDTSRAHHMLPHWMGPLIAEARIRKKLPFARSRGLPVLEYIALTNRHAGSSSQTVFGTKNASLARAVVEHGCRRKPAIARLRPDGVEFVDGTCLPIDTIICATGFRPAFPYFTGRLAAIGQDALRPRETLYRHCFHPEMGARMAFGGYARPAFGAIPPIAEMQARWFALVCRGAVSLPSPEQMRMRIYRDDLEARRQFGAHAERLGSLTDFLRILDTIAGEIGCRPEGLRWRHPKLWWKALIAPIMGAQYRLVGPGRKPEIAAPALARAPHDPELLAMYLALGVAGEILGRIPGLDRLRPAVPWI